MAGSLSEQLFDAINLIASKKVSNLPYDQTIVCTIVDNTNAANGEYTVNDGTSEFVTYSENPDYRVNTRVYVNIPNNDRLNKTHITGEYIEDANGNYLTYISPMNNFVDLTGDLIPSDISEKEFSLLANDPQRRFITVWTSPSGKVYRNYTCLGIQGNFRTNFPADTPTIGNYGLAVYLDYTTADGTNMSKILYFDCSEMFGNPYIFTTKYLQEKLFDISGMDAITSIQIAFYQSKNFEIVSGTPLEYADLNEDNLFVSDILVRLGELLTKYETDTVRLICNDNLQYKFDEPPLSRKMYLRWIHKEDNSLIVIDLNEDNDLAEDLTVTLSTGKVVPNYVVRWYRYNLKNGVHDTLAGNFWTQMDDVEVPWSQEIIPNDKVLNDRFKVIIEYPYREGVYDNLINLDEDYAVLYEAAKDAAIAGGVSEAIFKMYVERYIREIVSETDLDESGQPIVVDFYTKYCENEAVVALYQNSDIANLRAYITETKSKIQYYESEVITFENKVEVALEDVDLIQGLNIVVDADNGGHNGVYRLYDETNNIINTNESRKVRHMTATYTSIALGIDSLDQAEEIMWCFPLEYTMIQLPQEGYEFNTDNGDEYFEVDALDATNDASAAQAVRAEAARRYDATHNTNWEDKLEFTVEQLEELLAIEVAQLDVNASNYLTTLKTLKEYYKNIIEYILAEDYATEIASFASEKGKYGVIRRTGSEVVNNELGEQLIEVGLDFRIKPYYVPTYTNNNIVCLVKRNKRVYQAVATLHFASLGTSGTEATFFLTMCDLDGYEIGGLIPGSSITIRPYLYDYNNAPIDFESQVGYKWYSEPYGKYVTVDGKTERQNVIEMTLSGNDLILTARADMELSDGAHAILQGEAKYTISYTNGKLTDPNVPLEEKQRTVTLTTYLPIPLRASSEVTHISGATKIIYDSNGTNPSYYKDPYELHTKNHVNTDNIEWVLMGDEIDDPTTGKYYPTLSSDYALVANNMYFANMKPISAIAYGLIEGMTGPQEIWVQPIIIMQNRYGSAMMNNWDGSLLIDEENGTILSLMVGAGVKNEDNTFSGVLMGNVALADEKIGNKTGLGLYGFHHGELAFGLNVDGTAFFGKAGSGRIEFDGNKGTIQSYNYVEPHSKTVYGEDGKLIDQETGEFLATRTTTTGSGLLIDLDDSTISAYGKTGSLLINTNKYGQPLFVIRDADFSKNIKGNTLFYVSSNASDPQTGQTYDAKYFLLSANYTGTDPEDLEYDDDDPDVPSGGYATGALFDLENGKLDIHGKAGRVFIHGDGSNDLFQIRGWKGSGSDFIKNTLMNVAPNRYYLLSIDYKANQKGFKLDISSGKMMASDFNIKAGNARDGMILLTTTGAPYFSITTGTDYIEEKVNGNVVYACYDAIDLEDVDALFEPGLYWVRNTEKPGYYAVDMYMEELYIYDGNDPEFLKLKYYYRYNDENVPEENRVLDDAHLIRVDTMLPDDTWCFEDTLLADAPKLYQRLPNPIVLDDSYYFTAGRLYYADAEGNLPVTLYDNSSYYKFKELRAAGTLYRQSITPQRDDGSIGFLKNRVYYTVNDETLPEVDRKYTAVRFIVDSRANYDVWEANKYYYKTVLGAYARSQTGFVENQDYYVAKDPATDNLTPKLVLTLGDDAFKPVSKPLVSPTTYFYEDKTLVLWFYNDDWELVGANEAWSATNRYGIKRTDTDGGIRAINNVIDDERYLYAANKWYYEKEIEEYEALTEWKGNNFTYYYKWYDLYLKCENVIEKETNNIRIFKSNKYYRYIANKKFLLAQEFYDGEHYYDSTTNTLEALDLDTLAGLDTLASLEISLCDLNCLPYGEIAVDGVVKNFNLAEGGTRSIRGDLYWLKNDGTYAKVLVTLNNHNLYIAEDFVPSREYFIRYLVGLRNPDGSNSMEGLSGIHSVKLVNITKSRFELKSNNWNGSDTGMYLYLNSNSYVDEAETMGEEDENTGAETSVDEGNNYVPEPTAASGVKRKVGGGYIVGYGYYTTKLLDGTIRANYPIFRLDWRAGQNRAPIDVNNGAFKVYWNGKVHINNVDANRGRIGTFYLNNTGLFSFNPDRVSGTGASPKIGLGLLPKGLADDGLGDRCAVSGVILTTLNPTALRLLLGTFTTSGVVESGGTGVSGEPTVVTETYYEEDPETGEMVEKTRDVTVYPSVSYTPSTYSLSVNKYGYMRAYGAYLDTATLEKCSIEDANITTGYIGGFKLADGKLEGSGTTISPYGITTNNLKATGGKIGGWTITASSLRNGSAILTSSKLGIGDAYFASGAMHVGGTTILGSTASFAGAVTVSGNFTSQGTNTLGGNTTISGNTTVSGYLEANSYIKALSALFGGNVEVTGNVTGANVTATGALLGDTLYCSSGFQLSGGGTIYGGAAIYSGATINGGATCDTLTVGGNTINAEMASLDAEGMKTKLGLKALAYADDVSKKVNVSVTGSVKAKVSYGSYYSATPKYTDANGKEQSVSGTWYKKHSSDASTTITITLSGSGSKEYTFAPDGSGDAASITVKFNGTTYTSSSTSTATVTMG